MSCPFCDNEGAELEFIEAVGDGRGKYECTACEATLIKNTPFVELSDEEAEMVAGIANGKGKPEVVEEVFETRAFAQGASVRFRRLLEKELETPSAHLDIDRRKAKDLYERIDEKVSTGPRVAE